MKVNSGTESCMLCKIAYRRMFLNSITTDGLSKPDASQSLMHSILVLHGWHSSPIRPYHRNGKPIPIFFFVVDTKNETIISHAVSTHLGLHKYCVTTEGPRAVTSTPSEQVQQPEYTSTTVAFCPLHHHNAAVLLHNTINHLFPHHMTIPFLFIHARLYCH